MTATEAARNFSEVLNRVADGELVEVVRNGAPVAVIGAATTHLLSAERFRELIASAPPVDEAFAEDVRAAREAVGSVRDPWPS